MLSSATGSVAASYVVACDGGNGSTRGHLGVCLEDFGFSEPWLVCDFRLEKAVDLPMAQQYGDPDHELEAEDLLTYLKWCRSYRTLLR